MSRKTVGKILLKRDFCNTRLDKLRQATESKLSIEDLPRRILQSTKFFSTDPPFGFHFLLFKKGPSSTAEEIGCNDLDRTVQVNKKV